MNGVGSSLVSAMTQTPASGPRELFTVPEMKPSGSTGGAALASVGSQAAAMAAKKASGRLTMFMRILRRALLGCGRCESDVHDLERLGEAAHRIAARARAPLVA